MERFEHFNEQPGTTGSLAAHYDDATGKVMADGSGLSSVRQTTAFFNDWRHMVERIHATGQFLTAFVDMSEGTVQTADVVAAIGHGTAGIYADGDAIAMLMPSSLAKMQMRRVLDPLVHAFFISRHAAETWLEGRTLVTLSNRALQSRSPCFGMQRTYYR